MGTSVFLKKRFFLTFYWNPNETIITTAKKGKMQLLKAWCYCIYSSCTKLKKKKLKPFKGEKKDDLAK